MHTKLVKVQPLTATLKKDGTLNAGSIYRLLIAHRRDGHHSSLLMDDDSEGTSQKASRAIKHATNKYSAQGDSIDFDQVGPHLNTADKYVKDQTVDHTIERGRTSYQVRLHEFLVDEDTAEPAKLISNDFIRQYWRRRNRHRHRLLWARRSQTVKWGER